VPDQEQHPGTDSRTTYISGREIQSHGAQYRNQEPADFKRDDRR